MSSFYINMLYCYGNFTNNRTQPFISTKDCVPGGSQLMDHRNLTLLTDLYELTMMQGYFKEKDVK